MEKVIILAEVMAAAFLEIKIAVGASGAIS